MISLKKAFAISAIGTLSLTAPSAQAQDMFLEKGAEAPFTDVKYQAFDNNIEEPLRAPFKASRTYIKLGGGISELNDISYANKIYKVKPESGNNVQIGIGHNLNDNLRVEFNYEKNHSKSYKYNNETYNKSIKTDSLLTSLNYDIKLNSPLTPYVGASLGCTNAHSEYAGKTETVFTHGAQAGASYKITEKVSVGAEYKYRKHNKAKKLNYTNSIIGHSFTIYAMMRL